MSEVGFEYMVKYEFIRYGDILHKSMMNHVLTFEDMTLEKLELLESSS